MFRLAVALYLMVMTVAGPAVCCCSLPRLTARSGEQPSAPPCSAPASCPCCPHSHDEQPADAPEQPSPPASPDGPGCPCKQAVDSQIAGLPVSLDEAQEFTQRIALGESFCLCLALWAPIVPATVSSVFRESAPAGPSVSTDDLLYSHHVLRC